MCVHNCHTQQRKTVLIIFPLILQTIIIAQMKHLTYISSYYSHYCFHLMAIISRELGSASSLPWVLLLHLFLKRTSGITGTGLLLMSWMYFQPPNSQCQRITELKGTQSINLNQQPGLLLASSTTGLLTKGVLLCLHRLSNTIADWYKTSG